MAYRNGTYIAFYAQGTNIPTDSDIKYYDLIKAWSAKSDGDFTFVNSHEKTAAVRDSSKNATLKRQLQERLRNSKNMLLIIGKKTKEDTDWVPFEIRYAVDTCKIPIIAAYTGEITNSPIFKPMEFSLYWPAALKQRIESQAAHVIHIPFMEKPIQAAINQFGPSNLSQLKGLTCYTKDTYDKWNYTHL